MNEDELAYDEGGQFLSAYVGKVIYKQIDGKWIPFELNESGEWVEI